MRLISHGPTLFSKSDRQRAVSDVTGNDEFSLWFAVPSSSPMRQMKAGVTPSVSGHLAFGRHIPIIEVYVRVMSRRPGHISRMVIVEWHSLTGGSQHAFE